MSSMTNSLTLIFPSPTYRYRSKVMVIQRSRMYTTFCLMVTHVPNLVCLYQRAKTILPQTQIHGENFNKIVILRPKVKVK